jgi:hypothetical protein
MPGGTTLVAVRTIELAKFGAPPGLREDGPKRPRSVGS